jgi:hypothetical protein
VTQSGESRVGGRRCFVTYFDGKKLGLCRADD